MKRKYINSIGAQEFLCHGLRKVKRVNTNPRQILASRWLDASSMSPTSSATWFNPIARAGQHLP
jgi:hypothetical protein